MGMDARAFQNTTWRRNNISISIKINFIFIQYFLPLVNINFLYLTYFNNPNQLNLIKKISVVIVCLVAVLFLSTKIMAQEKKVALVTFYCDKKIGGTGLGSAGESLMNDPNFNLKPIVEKAYTTFTTQFAKDFPFKLVDKATVTENPAYKAYESKFLWDTTKNANKLAGIQYAVVDGFIWAFAGGSLVKAENRDEVNLYKILQANCDGVMFVNLDYEITPGMGGFSANITAYFNMTLWDKNGKKVFTIRESGASKKKVAAVGGIPVMSVEKIQPLCEDATNVLFAELQDKINKIVKKSANF